MAYTGSQGVLTIEDELPIVLLPEVHVTGNIIVSHNIHRYPIYIGRLDPAMHCIDLLLYIYACIFNRVHGLDHPSPHWSPVFILHVIDVLYFQQVYLWCLLCR